MNAAHRTRPIIIVTDARGQRAVFGPASSRPPRTTFERCPRARISSRRWSDATTSRHRYAECVIELDCPGEIETVLQRVHASLAGVPTVVVPRGHRTTPPRSRSGPTRPSTCRRRATRTRSIGSSRRSDRPPRFQRTAATTDTITSSRTNCPTKPSSSARTARISRRRFGPNPRICTRCGGRPRRNHVARSPTRSPRSYRGGRSGRSEPTTSSRSSTRRTRPTAADSSRLASSRSMNGFRPARRRLAGAGYHRICRARAATPLATGPTETLNRINAVVRRVIETRWSRPRPDAIERGSASNPSTRSCTAARGSPNGPKDGRLSLRTGAGEAEILERICDPGDDHDNPVAKAAQTGELRTTKPHSRTSRFPTNCGRRP